MKSEDGIKMDIRKIKNIKSDMIKIGRAMLDLGLQNTHSGNISVREGNDLFITKTGSMKGHLEERDIVLPGLFEPEYGLFQASSETGTHREILKYAGSAIHAHSLPATLLSYLMDEVKPLDFLGSKYLGNFPVVEFKHAVGSKEMEDNIPIILKEKTAMIVKTHGPFVRGKNVYDAFFKLNILDYTSEILLHLNLLETDSNKISELQYPGAKNYFPPTGEKETKDKELLRQFKKTAYDLFYLKISPFHTGSLSVEDGDEMLYSPRLSSPDYIGFDIKRINIKKSSKDFFINLHSAVYNYTTSKSAIFSHSPFGMIQGIKALVEGKDRIIPIDAEGSYLYPAIPVLFPNENIKKIVETAAKYKIVIIAGLGALSVGHTPGHSIHHNSSLRNIAYLKTKLQIMEKLGNIKSEKFYENKKVENW